MKKICLAFSLACVALLSGCLIPEHFVAKIEVQPDASYTFHYAGTAVHGLAAAEIKKNGSLSEKSQNGYKLEADKMTKNQEIRRAAYKGNGRYELEIESKKKPGEALRMFDIFTVNTGKDGVMTIASNEVTENSKQALEKLGIIIDGTLEVRLPRNAEIISSNATSTPTFFGLFGAYSWKIGRLDQRPMLKIKLKP